MDEKGWIGEETDDERHIFEREADPATTTMSYSPFNKASVRMADLGTKVEDFDNMLMAAAATRLMELF